MQQNKKEIYNDILFLNITNNNIALLADAVSKNLFFTKIICYKSPKKDNRLFLYLKERFLEYFFPQKAIDNELLSDDNIRITFDHLIGGYPNPFFVNLAYLNKNAEIIFIEDGLGSYYKRIGSLTQSLVSKIIGMFTKRSSEHLNPDKVYVYRPEICKIEYNTSIMKLNSSFDSQKIINKLFNNDLLNNNYFECIYFGQPYLIQGYNKIELEVCESVKRVFKNFVIRPHPRQDKGCYNGFKCEYSNALWESICKYDIDGNSVLIGTFSTAQFSPKFIYDTEPYIVFTYKLYRNIFSRNEYDKINNILKNTIQLYQNKSKIVVPETKEELILNLKHIKNIIANKR